MDIVNSLQNAISIAGKLRDLSKKIEDADFRMYWADLSNELAEAKLEAANLKIELAKLTTRCYELEQKTLQVSSDRPTLSDGVYKFENDAGQYCTACFNLHSKKVQVTSVDMKISAFGKWRCPSCKSMFKP